MSAHLTRAQLLLSQSRPADAEREVMLALAQQPDHPLAHAYLALSRIQQNKTNEALESARAAVGLAPDGAYFHYILALVLHRANREKEALAAVEEAIRLDPNDESHFALLASIRLALREWNAALEAAERGLALNPEHVESANLRSMALVRLGRRGEAVEAIDYALAREPENALSHANQGWNYLHRNEPAKAQEHFREALRLHPDFEYARQGMLEALKARNPVYRGMLAYYLWTSRISGRLQAVVVIVTFYGVRAMRGLAASRPELGYVLWPILGLFYLFVYLTWTSVPMFNLLLRLDRFGRLVLSRDERKATNWFGLCLLGAIWSLIFWFATKDELGLGGAIAGALLSVCVAMTFARSGRKRLIFGVATAALAAAAIGALATLAYGNALGSTLAIVFLLGVFALQIAANFIRR